MTTVILTHENERYYTTMSFEARTYGNVYIVETCPRLDSCRCGYPERQMIYGENERKKAVATFKRYCKKYI